ncbi:MAG TPA: Wzz/FepE/Etk N-terminal domain-containing protein [Povalibacter sp.]|nr:Wzz/FepE/Etk N-terminal domain-containing protein [Povalibacter sp.]
MSTRNDLQLISQVPSLPSVAGAPDPYAPAGLSLQQIWTILWAYRKASVLIAAAVVVCAVIAIALLPRTYEATATLMVDYEVNDPLNSKEFPIGLLGGYMATQTELLRNPAVLLTVVDRLQLTKNRDYTAGYSGNAAQLREYVMNQLSKRLSIYQGQFGSQLIYITFAADDPEHAALVANTVADVFKELDFARASSPAAARARRYSEQLEQLRAKAGQAQQQYTDFYQKHALIDTGDRKADVDLAFLSDLEQQLIDAQRARRAAEARGSDDPDVRDQVLGSTLVQNLKTQLAAQRSRLAELQNTLGSRHPEILQLQAQIAETRQRLDEEIGGYARNAASGAGAARKLEAQLQSAVAAQRQKVLSANELHDQADKLRLELESAQAVYKRALDGYDQVMFASTGNYTNINFVNRATVPVKPSKPRVLVLLLLGVVAGTGLGLVAPLAYELVNRRIRCRDDLERDEGVPVLAQFGSLSSLEGAA